MTASRLAAARLTDIKRPVSWRFTEAVVVIENEGKPLPEDLLETLLGDSLPGDASAPARLEATWKLDEPSGILELSQWRVDGQPVTRQVTLPIKPAGHVRVNLAGRQYNVFPADAVARSRP